MTPLPRPEPPTNRDIGRNRCIFGIVRRAPHVVCVQATATTAADGDQIVRCRAERSHHRVEGRSLTTRAWSQNEKPRRWKRHGFGIPGGDGRRQNVKHHLSTAAPNGLQPENAIFRTGTFCPPEASGTERSEAVKQHLSDVPEGLATMQAPDQSPTLQPVRWTGVPPAIRAAAPDAVMARFARTAPGKAGTSGETRPGAPAPGDRNAGERRDPFAAAPFHQQPRGRRLTRTA